MVKTKKYSRVMSMILALVLVFTSVLPANAAGMLAAEPKAVQEGTSKDPNAYAIYPIPQNITYAGGEFALSDEVVVVAEEGVDLYTVAFLEKILKEYDVTYTKETAVQEGKTNIRLCIQDSANLEDPALFEKNDAYMLDANDGMIVISGKDADSVYYGVATLQMMFSSFAGKKILNAHIEDYAEVAKRGYIEGFYGAWTFEERENLMRSMGNYKMNSYVYAAKGDAYHTSKWAELYPADMLAQFENLVKVGKETKVKFGWSVHLGTFFKTLTDANYEEMYAKLLAKIDQLHGIGVEKFDVLNDDFGGGSHETVVAVLNRLNNDLKARGCEPLTYCPQGYNIAWSGNGAELAALRNLDSDITIYWTGADVNSPITQDSVNYLTEKSNHQPDFWLNYPVNEHGKSGIYLGDITHYARDGVTGMAGFHSNPSRFAYANEVGLYQLAALVWNNNNYTEKAEEIWLSAFDYLQPEVEDAYRLIARNVSNCPGSGRVPQGFHESEYLAEKLNTVQALIASGAPLKDNQEAKDILAEFEAMITAVAEFREKCANPGLVANLDPWLKSLDDLAHAGKAALESLFELEKNNVSTAWEKLSEATKYYDTMYTYLTAPDLPDNPAKAGSKRLAPFVTAAISAAKNQLGPILNPNDDTITPSLYARMGGVDQQDDANGKKLYDGDETTIAGWQTVQKAGDYYGLDLGKVVTVRDIAILQGQTDTHHDIFHDAVLQVSEDKENWTNIDAVVDGPRITADGLNVKARYVRYYLKTTGFNGKPDYWTFVREFTVNKEIPEYDRIYTNVDTLKTTPLTIGGAELSVRNLKSVQLNAGEYVGIKLVNPGTVTKFVKDVSNNGLTFEYSYNETEWTTVPAELSENVAAKYVRLINKTNAAITADINKIGMTIDNTVANPKVVDHNLNNALKAGSFENLFDGDLATYAWTNEAQQTGDYILVDLGGNIKLHDVRIVTADGNPRFYNAEIQASADKKEWTTLTSVPGNAEYDVVNPPYRFLNMDAEGQNARYLKIAITGNSGYYLQIYEIEVNKSVEADGTSDTVLTNMSGNKENIADNDIATLFAADAKAGSFVEYRISENTNVDQITVVQGQAGNGKVIAKTQAGNKELGVLDESIKIFDTSAYEAVTAVRIEWDQEEEAAIHEIFVSCGANASDDIGQYVEPIIDEGGEEPETPEPTNIALGKAVVSNGCEIAGANNEKNVNDGNIATKWDGVHLKDNDIHENSWIYIDLGADKQYEISKVVAKYFNKVYPTDYELQVSDDTQNWKTVKTVTKPDAGPTHPVDTFDLPEVLTARYVRLFFRSVNAAAGGSGVAVTEFEIYGIEKKPVEKAALNEAIAAAEALNAEDYTEASWNALQEALNAAKAVAAKADAKQAEVDAAAEALNAAIDALEEAAAENIALGKAVVSNGCEIADAANEGNVNDGNISTKWDGVHLKGSNAQENSWIYIDLGKQYDINKVVAKYFNKVYPTDYDLQVSADDQKWTTVQTVTKADNGPAHPVDTFELAEAVTARYVRLFFRSVNANAAGNGVAVTEFEIYGTESAVPVPTTYHVEVVNGTMQGGETEGNYEYNTKLTVTANAPKNGKVFAGWEVNGNLLSTSEKYTFFVGTDLTVEAVYADEQAQVTPQAILQATSVTKRADGRYDIRYLGQLVLPEEGCELKNAGLVWSNKGLDTEDALQMNADGTAKAGVKVTKISKISNTYQFTVTIKGVPENTTVPGRIFAEIVDSEGQRYIYSEILKPTAK